MGKWESRVVGEISKGVWEPEETCFWFSPASTVMFLVLMSIAGGVLTLVVVAIHRARKKERKPQVPYGVAIAFGALAILTQRFLNQFA